MALLMNLVIGAHLLSFLPLHGDQAAFVATLPFLLQETSLATALIGQSLLKNLYIFMKNSALLMWQPL
jgi:hypothetical protein